MSEQVEHEVQRVLTVPSSSVVSLYEQERFHEGTSVAREIKEIIKSEGRFTERPVAEKQKGYVQVIAYGVLRNHNKLLCIQRASNSNRSVLRLKYTVLFGGHVDDDGSPHPLETCVLREMEEELGVGGITQLPKILGVVTDPTTRVGRLHLGVLFDIPYENDWLEMAAGLDAAEFKQTDRRGLHNFIDWEHARQLAQYFDPWSRLFLASDCAQSLMNASEPIIPDVGFPFNWNKDVSLDSTSIGDGVRNPLQNTNFTSTEQNVSRLQSERHKNSSGGQSPHVNF